jgi:ADP-ribosylglycohydrolase
LLKSFKMIGAIVGDIVGSYFEHFPTKSIDFDFVSERSMFTDDTVLTVAVADWLLNGGDLRTYFHDYVERYPGVGYGGTFLNWARSRELAPYDSWGNGSAMRVSPVAYARDSLPDVLGLAEQTAVVTHNHPEGIRGARAVAGCVFVTRNGGSKDDVRRFVAAEIGYDLSRTIDMIRPCYSFDVSCAGSVPEAITAFLEATSVEHAIRLAVSLGGDSDTMACIAGAIAEPFFGGVPDALWLPARGRLDDNLASTIAAFRRSYKTPNGG